MCLTGLCSCLWMGRSGEIILFFWRYQLAREDTWSTWTTGTGQWAWLPFFSSFLGHDASPSDTARSQLHLPQCSSAAAASRGNPCLSMCSPRRTISHGFQSLKHMYILPQQSIMSTRRGSRFQKEICMASSWSEIKQKRKYWNDFIEVWAYEPNACHAPCVVLIKSPT